MSEIEILAVIIWVGLAIHLFLFWCKNNISITIQEIRDDYNRNLDEITRMFERDYESDKEEVDELKLELQKQIKQVKEERDGEH